MLLIGLTGGIGSGKTTVSRIFGILGVQVYNADERAKFLMNNRKDLRDLILERFGTEAYLPDGTLHRAYLAARVFSDPLQLRAINKIVHPFVFKDTQLWAESHSGRPYGIVEAAVLFESGAYRECHYTICVHAPEKIRVDRVVARDHVMAYEVLERMQHQLSEGFRLSLCDFVLDNGGERPLIPQVLALHRHLTDLAGQSNEKVR